MNRITGGTGKFAGIQGTAPFQCHQVSANGQWTCKQQFEYRLPQQSGRPFRISKRTDPIPVGRT